MKSNKLSVILHSAVFLLLLAHLSIAKATLVYEEGT